MTQVKLILDTQYLTIQLQRMTKDLTTSKIVCFTFQLHFQSNTISLANSEMPNDAPTQQRFIKRSTPFSSSHKSSRVSISGTD